MKIGLILVVGVALMIAAVATSAGTVPRAGSGFAAPSPSSPPTDLTARPEAAPIPLPVVGAADCQAPVTLARGVDEKWHNRAVSVRLEASDDASGVAATFHSLDGGQWMEGAELVVRAPSNHANDGTHVLLYFSIDRAGNCEEEQRAEIKIDTTPPRFSWVSISPMVIYRTRSVTFTFKLQDLGEPVLLRWRMVDQYGSVVAVRGGLERRPGTRSIGVSARYADGAPLMPGLYRVRFRLKDPAGNVTVTSFRCFRDYRPVQAQVWRRVPGAGRRVALTFDDGNTAAWRSILDTLKAHRAHATFFPLGSYVAAAPGLARRTRDEGHGIGSHGWTHQVMTALTAAEVRSELTRSEAPWWEHARATPVPYVRPPYGIHDADTLAALGSGGYRRVIDWDVDPQDWRDPGSAVIASRVLSSVQSGSIVLLHLRPQTAAALPAILKGLKARGYTAVSVPELFRAAGHH